MTFLATNLFSLYHFEAVSQEREIQIINQMTFIDFALINIHFCSLFTSRFVCKL